MVKWQEIGAVVISSDRRGKGVGFIVAEEVQVCFQWFGDGGFRGSHGTIYPSPVTCHPNFLDSIDDNRR